MNPLAPVTNEDALRKLEAYEVALERMWKEQPSDTTAGRYQVFMRHRTLKRLLWVQWIEANVEKIDWCRELVLIAVTEKLK